MSDAEVLNVDEVAEYLQLGKSTVYRALEEGRLPGQKVCGRWRTLRSQLVDLVTDGRIPAKRESSPDPMPRPSRPTGSFRAKVVDIERARSR